MLQPIQPTKQLNARWIRFSDSMKYSFCTISGAVFFPTRIFFLSFFDSDNDDSGGVLQIQR